MPLMVRADDRRRTADGDTSRSLAGRSRAPGQPRRLLLLAQTPSPLPPLSVVVTHASISRQQAKLAVKPVVPSGSALVAGAQTTALVLTNESDRGVSGCKLLPAS